MSSTASAQTQASSCVFGVWGIDELNIRDRTSIAPGIIGSQNHVFMGVEAKTNGDILAGGAVFMANQAVSYGNIHYNQYIFKQDPTYIIGNENQIDQLYPIELAYRSIPSGTDDVTLNYGQTVVLQPGNYKDLRVNAGATLELKSGVYNFNRFIVEGGPASIIFDSEGDFIEINAEAEMRFGDRNAFLLQGDTEPAEIQFYTNSSSQIKIGTDSSFKGVVTAPYGQIYVFSRSTVEGNLLGKSVWIDTDSTVFPVQNCSAYNTPIDYTPTINACNGVSFEELRWLPVGDIGNASYNVTEQYATDGELALEVALNDATELTFEALDNFNMIFSEDATDVSIKLDVYSNAAPLSEWGAEFNVYLADVADGTYALAGTASYDREADVEEMTTLSIDLSADMASMVMTQPVKLKFEISTAKENAVFWIDDIRFCDNLGDCNISCPEKDPAHYSAPESSDVLYDSTIVDGDSAIVENVDYIGGEVHIEMDRTAVCEVEAVFRTAMNMTETISLGEHTFTPGVEIPFYFTADELPFDLQGLIVEMTIVTIEQRTAVDGNTYTFRENAGSRYYTHNSDDTITHFNEQEFFDTYYGFTFLGTGAGTEIPLLDELNNVGGYIVAEEILLDEDLVLEDDTETDTDTSVDTSTIIVVE